jgi:hypothetical protein
MLGCCDFLAERRAPSAPSARDGFWEMACRGRDEGYQQVSLRTFPRGNRGHDCQKFTTGLILLRSFGCSPRGTYPGPKDWANR